MFDLKTDNQLMSLIAALAAGAVLLTGAAAAVAADVREDDPRPPRRELNIDRALDRWAEEAAERRAKQRRAERRAERRAAANAASIQGVPRSTLEAIAACESGGDPRAVNAAGYYGKYQFSIGTWQAVGGEGNPAEASEAEQDLRAAILYNQSGPSQWPVCGV